MTGRRPVATRRAKTGRSTHRCTASELAPGTMHGRAQACKGPWPVGPAVLLNRGLRTASERPGRPGRERTPKSEAALLLWCALGAHREGRWPTERRVRWANALPGAAWRARGGGGFWIVLGRSPRQAPASSKSPGARLGRDAAAAHASPVASRSPPAAFRWPTVARHSPPSSVRHAQCVRLSPPPRRQPCAPAT